MSGKLTLIGLCPCWDTVCQLEGVDWGQHKVVSSCIGRPAGKALNISRALAWMGQRSIAAGLWGRDDYEQMLKAMQPLKGLVKVKMTAVEGATRQNITVVDTVNNREMHLRSKSELASKAALRKLKSDLDEIVKGNSVCVFAGAMPENRLLGDVVRITKFCREHGAKIALDTSGQALREIIGSGSVWLVKPNIEELSELLDEQIGDNPTSLAKAGRKLLDKVEIVLISRGKKGAIVVTKERAWQGRCAGHRRVLSTVGCGDYLLAGFLKALKDKCYSAKHAIAQHACRRKQGSDEDFALETAIKVATARAWGWTERRDWLQVERQIKVKVDRM